MPKVVGVRFRTSPRMYWFSPGDVQYKKNDKVVVETQRGTELATIIMEETEVEENKLVSPLKPVLRLATDEDIELFTIDEEQKRDILQTAKEKVAARGLQMKVVDCEYTIDRSKLVLYFTAEQRVDFRELVRDLASAFHIRIDLRQIGPRDECKLIGSLGTCGLPCCCGRFESDTEHVSIKMAKNQNLALTPNKINGMCGRLLCCLSYENKTYEDVARRSPKHGARVTLPDGREGSVVSVTPLTEKVRVRVGDEENFEFVECSLSELNGDRREPQKQAEKNEQSDAAQNNTIGDNERGEENRKKGDKKRFNKRDRRGAQDNAPQRGNNNNDRNRNNNNNGSNNNGNNSANNNNGGKRNKHKRGKRPHNGGEKQQGGAGKPQSEQK